MKGMIARADGAKAGGGETPDDRDRLREDGVSRMPSKSPLHTRCQSGLRSRREGACSAAHRAPCPFLLRCSADPPARCTAKESADGHPLSDAGKHLDDDPWGELSLILWCGWTRASGRGAWRKRAISRRRPRERQRRKNALVLR